MCRIQGVLTKVIRATLAPTGWEVTLCGEKNFVWGTFVAPGLRALAWRALYSVGSVDLIY